MSPSLGTTRRTVLQTGSLVLLLGAQQIAYGAAIVAVRVWPAQDYSRVTIESDQQLKTTHIFVANPPRLAVDIEGLQLEPSLRELLGQVQPNDPNIAGIRVGQFAPNVVRLVVDLKRAAKPQVFTLSPVAAYQHRLVFDLYPEEETDPLVALLAERLREVPTPAALPDEVEAAAPAAQPLDDPIAELLARHGEEKAPDGEKEGLQPKRRVPPPTTETEPSAPPPVQVASSPTASEDGKRSPKRPANPGPVTPPAAVVPPKAQRIIIVALDPGHGGEDPGAIGARASMLPVSGAIQCGRI